MTHPMLSRLAVVTLAALTVLLGAAAPGALARPAPDAPESSWATGDQADAPAHRPATHRYIVVLEEPPLASYRGGLPGLPATHPETVRRVDPARYRGVHVDIESPQARAYIEHLKEAQEGVIRQLRYLAPEFTARDWQYQVTLNGFTAQLTYDHADQARRVPGVKLVYPAEALVPDMDSTKDLVGTVRAWEAAGGVAEAGLGARVGTMEAGGAVRHPFFSDEGMPQAPAGYPVAKVHLRDGTVTDIMTATNVTNNKVLGMRIFAQQVSTNTLRSISNGYYVSSHGSHVAGTITGRWGKYQVAPGIEVEMAGIAPMAQLFTYVPDETPEMLAAFEVMSGQDKVDAVNLSLGTTTWLMDRHETHPLALAMTGAADAGTLVVGSAGNAGGNGRTSLSGGWKYAEDLLVVGNTTSTGRTGVPLELAETDVPDVLKSLLVYPVKVHTETLTAKLAYVPGGGCNPADNVTGAIAVIERFTAQSTAIGTCDFASRAQAMKNSGAKAILYLYYDRFNGASLTNVALPAISLGQPAAKALVDWLKAGNPLTASYGLQAQRDYLGVADYLAGSSSRGPGLDWTLKPDISAPGTDILSSVLVDNNTGDDIPPSVATWPAYSGTSMAAPHVTGAAGLLRSMHPDWTVQQLRSALITSAEPTILTGLPENPTAADVTMGGPGRLDLSDAHDPRVFMDPPKASFGVLAPGEQKRLEIAVSSANGETTWWDVAVEPGPGSGSAMARPNATVLTVQPDKPAILGLSLDVAAAGKAENWGYVVLRQRSAPPGIYLPALQKNAGFGETQAARGDAPAQDDPEAPAPDGDDLRTLRVAYYAYVNDPAVRKDVLLVNWTYGNTPNHLPAYTEALDKLGLSYDVWWMGEAADQPGGAPPRATHPTYEEMYRHDLVILNTNESTVSLQLMLAGQFQYQNYMLGGGSFLIAGQGTPNFTAYPDIIRASEPGATIERYPDTFPKVWRQASQNVGCEMCLARYFSGFAAVYTSTLSGRLLLPYGTAPDRAEREVSLAPHADAEADSPFRGYRLDLSTGAMAKDGAKGNQYTFASGELLKTYRPYVPDDNSTEVVENYLTANISDPDDSAWTIAPGGRGKRIPEFARPLWSFPGGEGQGDLVVGTYVAGKHDPASKIAWNAMFGGCGLEGVGKAGEGTASRDELLGDTFNFLAKNIRAKGLLSQAEGGRPTLRVDLGRQAKPVRIARAELDWGEGRTQVIDYGSARGADTLSFTPGASWGERVKVTLYPERGTAAPIRLEAALER